MNEMSSVLLSTMSTDLKKQNAKIIEKRRVLPGDPDKKKQIINLQSFKDYKLSRSQLRQLTDLLEVPEDNNAITDNKNPLEKVSNKMKRFGSIASKNRPFLKTIMEVDELKCCSNFSKEIESEEKVLNKLNLHPVVMLHDVYKISNEGAATTTGPHEDTSIIDVVNDRDNKDEKGISPSNNDGDKRTAADVVNKIHKENGIENKIHLGHDTRHIASQLFKCMLCEEKNVDIPWDEILIHRWDHYKEIMTYNQYIEGLMEYPSEFKRP